jgi:hypothetical protein
MHQLGPADRSRAVQGLFALAEKKRRQASSRAYMGQENKILRKELRGEATICEYLAKELAEALGVWVEPDGDDH